MIPYFLTGFVLIPITIGGWIDNLDPKGNCKYENLLDSVKFMSDPTIFRRDEQTTLEGLVTTVYNSGIITDTLYEIASDDTQIDNLINITSSLLKGETALSDLDFGGMNISLNTTNLQEQILSSGIIPSTAEYLLMNETNRNFLSDFSGELLAKEIWVPKILNNLGEGQDLTMDMIVNTIKTTPNLNPKYNSSAPKNKEREDFWEIVSKANEGSAQSFLSNLVNGVLQSETFSGSVSSILGAINNTGIAGPLVMELAHNDTILAMVPKLVRGLYENDALNIDTNYYFQYAKKHALLADGLQWLLTSPKWEPPVAELLKRMELKGTYKDVQIGLFGPDK